MMRTCEWIGECDDMIHFWDYGPFTVDGIRYHISISLFEEDQNEYQRAPMFTIKNDSCGGESCFWCYDTHSDMFTDTRNGARWIDIMKKEISDGASSEPGYL